MLNDTTLIEKLKQDMSAQYSDALTFLILYRTYSHEIDDIIDEGWTPEDLLGAFITAAQLFSCKFYQQNLMYLYPLVLHVTNMYADTVKWEQENKGTWKQQFADVNRCCANDMLLVVIGLTLGYDKMREYSELVRITSWNHHHDKDGNPI
jgi:hypothetical protein